MISSNQKISILLVEDNVPDARFVEILLKESTTFSFSIKHVTSLQEGILAVKRGEQFHLALLDLTLPDSSGLETITKARAEFPDSMSIVVLTGLEDERVGISSIQRGAQDFLVKGQIDAISLTRSVVLAIERRRLQLQVEQSAHDLELSRKRLLQAQQIAHIGNYEMDAELNFKYWSQEMFRILNVTDYTEIPPTGIYLNAIVESEQELVVDRLQHALTNLSRFDIEHRLIQPGTNQILFVRNQGEVRQENNTLTILGTIQDITNIKRTEEMFIDSEKRYRTIFEESQDAIYISTRDGRFVEYNQSLLNLLGYTAEELSQLSIDKLFRDQKTRSEFLDIVEQKGSVKDYEIKLYKKDGTPIDCHMTTTVWRSLMGTETKRGYHGIIRDITAFKQRQQLVREKEIAIQSAKIKEQFLAKMSHEIRTPMGLVVGMTDLLNETNLTVEQRNYTEQLSKYSNELLELINRILDFSKLEAGKVKLESAPVYLPGLLQDIIEKFRHQADKKELYLKLHQDHKLPKYILGDAAQLKHIIQNLISNAIKYTNHGGIVLQAIVKEINLRTNKAKIYFCVSDSGIGIPDDKLKTVFDSFVQASEDTTRLYGGTGLGLSIVKELVELHGGDLGVSSQLNHGSKFHFTISFPIVNESEIPKDTYQLEPPASETTNTKSYSPSEAQQYKTTPADAASKINNVNILLVEDYKGNQFLAKKYLNSWRIPNHLDIAENGIEAIDKLKEKGPYYYDVILMDISMPQMDGYEATTIIRNEMDDAFKELPIIAMTAHALNRDAEKCMEIGMNDFIRKPAPRSELYQKLEKALAHKIDLTQSAQAQNSQTEATTPNVQAHSGVNIDLSYLASLTDGDTEIQKEMVATLIEEIPNEIEQVKTDAAAKNWDALKQSAHKMKATSSYIGLPAMRDLAEKVENNAWDKKDLDSIQQDVNLLVRNFNTAYHQLVAAYNKL